MAIAQLEERLSGAAARSAEQEARIGSLEDKHRQAREALEHFRTSAKEQRDQEHRRHEHQVQGLQVEIRTLQDSLTAKNAELRQLNREGARLSEQVTSLGSDVRDLKSTLRQRDQKIAELDSVTREVLDLRNRVAVEAEARQLAEERASGLEKEVQAEREARKVAKSLKHVPVLWNSFYRSSHSYERQNRRAPGWPKRARKPEISISNRTLRCLWVKNASIPANPHYGSAWIEKCWDCADNGHHMGHSLALESHEMELINAN